MAGVTALPMIAWISLVAGDPLVDPWENAVYPLREHEISALHEPAAPSAWTLDDNELLNPFGKD